MFYINSCNANRVDLDETPRYAASDMGLRSLQMPLLLDTRQKWVNHECDLHGSLSSGNLL